MISGGEEDVANMVLRLAISQMIADRAGQPLSILILDEVFGSLDIERRDGAFAWCISELAYTQMQSGSVEHAQLTRATAMPVLQPWMCAGPRNIGGRILSIAQDPTNALVLYAGAAPGFPGLDQVNVAVPTGMAGAGTVDVVVTVDGQASNTVTLTFR